MENTSNFHPNPWIKKGITPFKPAHLEIQKFPSKKTDSSKKTCELKKLIADLPGGKADLIPAGKSQYSSASIKKALCKESLSNLKKGRNDQEKIDIIRDLLLLLKTDSLAAAQNKVEKQASSSSLVPQSEPLEKSDFLSKKFALREIFSCLDQMLYHQVSDMPKKSQFQNLFRIFGTYFLPYFHPSQAMKNLDEFDSKLKNDIEWAIQETRALKEDVSYWKGDEKKIERIQEILFLTREFLLLFKKDFFGQAAVAPPDPGEKMFELWKAPLEPAAPCMISDLYHGTRLFPQAMIKMLQYAHRLLNRKGEGEQYKRMSWEEFKLECIYTSLALELFCRSILEKKWNNVGTITPLLLMDLSMQIEKLFVLIESDHSDRKDGPPFQSHYLPSMWKQVRQNRSLRLDLTSEKHLEEIGQAFEISRYPFYFLHSDASSTNQNKKLFSLLLRAEKIERLDEGETIEFSLDILELYRNHLHLVRDILCNLDDEMGQADSVAFLKTFDLWQDFINKFSRAISKPFAPAPLSKPSPLKEKIDQVKKKMEKNHQALIDANTSKHYLFDDSEVHIQRLRLLCTDLFPYFIESSSSVWIYRAFLQEAQGAIEGLYRYRNQLKQNPLKNKVGKIANLHGAHYFFHLSELVNSPRQEKERQNVWRLDVANRVHHSIRKKNIGKNPLTESTFQRLTAMEEYFLNPKLPPPNFTKFHEEWIPLLEAAAEEIQYQIGQIEKFGKHKL